MSMMKATNISQDTVDILMKNGLTRQQATSLTAQVLIETLTPDDGKLLLKEAREQVNAMKRELSDVRAERDKILWELHSISENMLAIKGAQDEYGELTDERAKNALFLYSAILEMGTGKNQGRGGNETEILNNAGYIVYAYLGGQAKREITYQGDKK